MPVTQEHGRGSLRVALDNNTLKGRLVRSGCWPAAFGPMDRIAARGVGGRMTRGRLRLRSAALAVAPGAVERNAPRKNSGASAFGGCWPAAIGTMDRIAARSVGMRITRGRMRIRTTALAVAPGYMMSNSMAGRMLPVE